MEIFRDEFPPQSVQNAALALHNGRSVNLTTSEISDLTIENGFTSRLFRCEDSRVTFANLAARNHCTALAVFSQWQGKSNLELFQTGHKLWRNEIGHEDSACGRFIGMAAENINALQVAAELLRSSDLRPFDILHVAEKAMPFIQDFEASDILEIAKAQYEPTKNDLAGGLIYRSIEQRLSSAPNTAWQLLEIVRAKPEEPIQNLYGCAFEALLNTDRRTEALEQLMGDAISSNTRLQPLALWGLARAVNAHDLTAVQRSSCIDLLISGLVLDSEVSRQAAIRSIAHCAAKEVRLLRELIRLATTEDSYALSVSTDFLFMNHESGNIDSESIEALCRCLIALKPDQSAAIENYDWVLQKLYENNTHRDFVVACLTGWVIRHGSSKVRDKEFAQLFDQTVAAIVNDPPVLQKLVTEWLIADEMPLPSAVGGLISFLWIRGFKTPIFSRAVLDTLTKQDLRLLIRRMLGYVISEEALLSLTYSLLETQDAETRTFGFVHNLYVDTIGRDYIGTTLSELAARQVGAPEITKKLLAACHDELKAYIDAIEKLPRLQELRAPLRLRRAIALNRSRAMNEAKEKASENSITRLFATQIPLKAGIGWFSVTDCGIGPTHQLQSVEHSVSLPRQALIDPVGYAIDGLYCRLSKRSDE